MAILKKKKSDYDPLEDLPPEKEKLKSQSAGADIESIKEEVGFPEAPEEEAPLEAMPPAPPVPPAPEAPQSLQAPSEAPPSETGQVPEFIQPAPAGQEAQPQEEDPLAFLGGAGDLEAPQEEGQEMPPAPTSELPQVPPKTEFQEAPLPAPTDPSYDSIIRNETEVIRREFETKMSLLKDEIQSLKKLDEEIKGVVEAMDRIEQKYEKVETRAEDNNTLLTETLNDVKSTVSAIDKIMSSALPALIKEVRSISEIKSKGK
ncbi:TPA: hypothetical protein H1011_00825 [archaeon]|uniref:Uncharacterized protein n=1 Tax=Candidatus Undinarchaeum marinum TaxID=2756141 RepID=A0A832UZ20_9ARCH|nr:hypothetical protein [Candidatus Undinarchaeum marinum]